LEGTGKKVRSVWEVTRAIKESLEDGFPHVHVEGEVSNFTRAASGHLYFGLKDARAYLPCVMWAQPARLLRFRPENGQSVVCRGRISVYEPRGAYQLVVDAMDAKGTGELLLAFERLKARLAAEGLFDPAHKKPLPALPERIGIVTSPSGAAVRDVLRVITGRFDNPDVLVLPARVQGEGAAREIADMIALANRHALCDVLIVTRGGGSIEDLWAFNEEVVARAIHASAIPVVSAVGHEIDVTIADLVADVRAATPSVAGELVVPRKADLKRRVDELREEIALQVGGIVHRKRKASELAVSRLRDPRGRLENRMIRVDDLAARLENALRHRLVLAAQRTEAARSRLRGRAPSVRIARRRADVAALVARIRGRVGASLRERRMRADALAGTLGALSPLAVLGRGYAIVHGADGRVLRDARRASAGEALRVRLARGEIGVRVTEVNTPPPEDGGD
jgi:exodeoxyribonuclease VII large subunit